MQAAQSRGWATQIIDEEGGLIEVTPDGKGAIRLKSSADPRADIPAYVIASRKDIFYRLGEKNDLPVPITNELRDFESACVLLDQYGKLVVKPNDASHGNGVSLGVDSPEKLKAAIALALKHSSSVLIQKQYSGNDYRVLVIGDEVVAATHRRPAFVVGDGEHTLSELIALENGSDKRAEGYSEKMCLINESAAKAYLGEAINEVPATGEERTVIEVPNIGQGGTSIDVTDSVSDLVRTTAIAAARMTGTRVAGVDFLAPSLSTNNPDEIVIIELNAIPSFGMHQLPNVGNAVDVASLFLDEISRQ